jgi:hypothetical protein
LSDFYTEKIYDYKTGREVFSAGFYLYCGIDDYESDCDKNMLRG